MNSVFNTIGKADRKSKLEYGRAINSDIIATIHKNYPQALKETASIAEQFRGENDLETVRNIWRFLRSKITYERDPEGVQLVRTPRRLLSDKKGDCKSYSLFANSILGNLKMPVAFRYASYSHDHIPTHVYGVTKDEAGNEIIVDGVYKHFAKEKPPIYFKDFPMQIYTLSGTGDDNTINGKKHLLKKFLNKHGDIIKHPFKGIKNGAKFLLLGPSRAAYLGLVALNVHGMGTHFADMFKKNPSKAKAFWQKLGGDWVQFQKTATLGAKQRSIFGHEEYDNSIGFAPAVAAALAAAAPIIPLAIKAIKEHLSAAGLAPPAALDQVNASALTELKSAGMTTADVDQHIAEGTVDHTPVPVDAGGLKVNAGRLPHDPTHGSFGGDLMAPNTWIKAMLITGLLAAMGDHALAHGIIYQVAFYISAAALIVTSYLKTKWVKN